ncbi:MAG: glycoside hydrolase family 30 beta sandwich domain-containing protein [Bacteroidota bacterium]
MNYLRIKKCATSCISALLLLLCFSVLEVSAQSVTVYQTTSSGSDKLERKWPNRSFGNQSSGGVILTVNGGMRYQTMDGFGAAMTGSSAYLFNRKMTSTQRNNVMNSLFSSSGIRLTFVRHSIGASDFSLSDYTYHDPGNNFSINVDKADVIPMLKLAKKKRGNLKILGTPWTAPAWMKDNFSMKAGKLKDNHLDDYALYLVRYLKAFKNEGLPIYAITMQNEPLHTTPNYPSMRMEWYQQSNLLQYHLGPLMAQGNVDNTKVLIYDHNWDVTSYARDILNESGTRPYVDGTAFHGYAGSVGAQNTVYNYNTSKGIWFTEQSGGDWSPNFGNNLDWYSKNLVVGAIRNWSKSLLLWNLALDTNDGPQNGGCSNCRGVVTVNNNGSFTKEVEYYVLGHLSKFVDPGAKRVEINQRSGIYTVAFRNGNGSFVVVAYNGNSSSKFVKVRHSNKQFGYRIPSKSLVTFKWFPTSGREELAEEDAAEELNEEAASQFVYPNPIENVFNVDLTQFGIDSGRFLLVDLKGQVVYEHHLNQQVTKIDLSSSFSPGIYFAYIDGEDVHKKMKVILK